MLPKNLLAPGRWDNWNNKIEKYGECIRFHGGYFSIATTYAELIDHRQKIVITAIYKLIFA